MVMFFMRIIKRKKGNKKYFYLQHSLRDDKKVITREKYLGTEIPDDIKEISEDILKETQRLLKPGGKLLIVDWKVEPTPFGPPQDNRLSPVTVTQLAAKLGFTLVKQFEAGPYHYGFVLIKQ